ncbi:protein RALF-like 19 [Cicer arietinum]|uniref:Protein RALF-like 19 n=1 Tax=Cicer arietinum TaxID=3827 RepID=A0A1S2XBR5_CICAR|nr:protein RALF-like 19 [Cicer arietinum]
MESKRGLVFLILALTLALAIVTEASKIHDFSPLVTNDENGLIEDDNEFLMSSEASHRILAGRGRYISYGALRANQVPCGKRGRSYYNCQKRGKANPYRRGCSVITHCARDTS